jgi:Na+-driven multidrug efflux pump
MTTQSKVEGDWRWIKNAVRKLSLLVAIFFVCGIIQVAVSTSLYKIWTHNKVMVPIQLSIIMCLYFVISNWGSIYSNFLNGVGTVKIQLYLSIFAMIFNIPLAIFLVKICHLGVIGIPVATITTMVIANSVALIQYKKIVSGNATGIWSR